LLFRTSVFPHVILDQFLKFRYALYLSYTERCEINSIETLRYRKIKIVNMNV